MHSQYNTKYLMNSGYYSNQQTGSLTVITIMVLVRSLQTRSILVMSCRMHCQVFRLRINHCTTLIYLSVSVSWLIVAVVGWRNKEIIVIRPIAKSRLAGTGNLQLFREPAEPVFGTIRLVKMYFGNVIDFDLDLRQCLKISM